MFTQMGVHWLFGFLDAVTSMRDRIPSRKGSLAGLPTHPPLAVRRMLANQEYDRWRLTSDEESDRWEENIANMQRLRQSVDNFNEVYPAAVADAYFCFPEEMTELQDDVIRRDYSDGDAEQYHAALAGILERSERELGQKHRKGWLGRLRCAIENWFSESHSSCCAGGNCARAIPSPHSQADGFTGLSPWR